VLRLHSAALAVLLLVAAALPAAAQDAAGVAGTVTVGDGPVAGAVVTLVSAEDPTDVVAATETDDGGAFALGADDGTYHLAVVDPSGALAYAWWEDAAEPTDEIVVADGAGPQDLELALREAAGVAGVVEGPDGPVEGVTVRVARTGLDPLEATTDDDGAFALTGLRAGEVEVEVDTADRPLSSTNRTVTLDEGAVAEVAFLLRTRPVGVERVAGPDRVATAVEASRRGFTTASTVVIADAGSFPDALAAAPLAARAGGPLLLVGDRVTPVLLDELRRLRATDAIVVGSIGAVPLIVQEELGREGLDVRRIAGDSRVDTAALIARELGTPDGRVIVASGASFADALAVAPYAAAERLPIILTERDALPADAVAALRAIGATETLVVGGAAVVSDAVLAAVPAGTRIAGVDRFATAIAVAEHWAERGMDLQTVHVATGRDFPDALAAGPLAGLATGPLLLVEGRDADAADAVYDWLAERREDIVGAYAFGGSAVLSDAVLARLAEAIGAGS
jgi:putative cell wall-binding protein